MTKDPAKKSKLKRWFAVLLLLAAGLGLFAWYNFFREVPQDLHDDEEYAFKYGSLGGEDEVGLPYWIWFVLPRVFDDLMPGPGGYAAFGFPWEPGEELPVGFSKKIVGFPRITNNCAICHTATWRESEDSDRHFVAAGPGHTTDVQSFLRFLSQCAADPRFTPDILLDEIANHTDLSLTDRLIHRFLLIPLTKKSVLEQQGRLDWMDRPGQPDWGPGRDDPMNLTKYFMTSLPIDDSVGQADFPSIWNLKLREGQSMNWCGETLSSRAVIIDSALGLSAPPEMLARMEAINDWLVQLPPPEYPFEVDDELAAQGRPLYEAHCANCHEMGWDQGLVGTVIQIDEIGTDRERLDTWSQAAADEANRAVAEVGIDRRDMVATDGYVAQPLDGVWLRAPYMHAGAVPNMRELLRPASERSQVFWRGYDVYDQQNMGFESFNEEAQRVGFLLDTALPGNGNQGHEYGTNLSESQRDALIEYLKTF